MDTIAGGWREHNNSPFTSISPCKFPFNDRTPERSNVIEEKASRTKENQVSVGIFRLKEALAIVRTNYSLSITCIKLHKFWNHHCARSCRVFPLDWFTVLFPFFLTNHVIIARIPPILAKKTDRPMGIRNDNANTISRVSRWSLRSIEYSKTLSSGVSSMSVMFDRVSMKLPTLKQVDS